MVNCSKCSEKIGFFQSRYDYKNKDGKIVKLCLNCHESSKRKKIKNKIEIKTPIEVKNHKEENHKEDTTHFDFNMGKRFEYIIRRSRNEEKNMELPKDPKEYTGDNCWICLDNGVFRWYKGFRRLCSDCIEVLDSDDDSNKSLFDLSKIKKKKREFLLTEQDRIEKEAKEREKQLKRKIEKEKLVKDKNAPSVSDYCKKYLQDKDFEFYGIILIINKDLGLINSIKKHSMGGLQEHFFELYKQAQDGTLSSSGDYDEIMRIESSCNQAIQLIGDIEKLKKLLDKKNIQTDYTQIFEEMVKIVEQDIKKTVDKLTFPAYKRISKITTTDKKIIIKEYLKIGFGEPDLMIISNLLDRFNLEHNDDEIEKLLQESIEEQELEEFEENLGIKKMRPIGDFDHLNGYQFEDYLKELFTVLGYQVIKTKSTGDQGADLIIKKDDQKTVVQAKKYSGSVTNKAIQEVVASKKHYGADKGMVVTTGKFTKSAFDLAKSNKVDLWDKNKLKQVVNEINESSISKNNLNSQQSSNLEGDHFPAVCPTCQEDIKLKIDDLPKKEKKLIMDCPECNLELGIRIPEPFYSCSGCKNNFDTVKERINHEKSCEKLIERKFNCKSCKKEFTLDDSEFEDLKKDGELNVECPGCNENNLIER